MQKKAFKLGIIGYGNMSGAICRGILKSGMLRPEDIIVFDKSELSLKRATTNGLGVAKDNSDIAERAEYLMLAVKPQSAEEVFPDLYGKNNIIISIMAGIEREYIRERTGSSVARAMPNIPVVAGCGVTAIDCNEMALRDREFISNIFHCVGEVVETDEASMHAVTAVSGSGPAYFFMFIDAIARKGIELGLTAEISKKLAVQTALGAAAVAKDSELSLEELTRQVCSPGGTTIEAVRIFEAQGLFELTNKAMQACYDRSKDLSELKLK